MNQWEYHFQDNLKIILDESDNYESSHHKIIIVDGIFGITGSVNMTEKSWQNLDLEKEDIDIKTKTIDVMSLNNKFSRTFSTLINPSSISILDEIPF